MGNCCFTPPPGENYQAPNGGNDHVIDPAAATSNPGTVLTPLPTQTGPHVPQATMVPVPPVPNERRVLVRALYRYDGQNDDDVRFDKGDIMEVVSNMGDAWWYARHLRTQQEGYIPSNYVLVDDGRPTSLEAWFDIGRREADRLLLLMGNPRGTYIIRNSSGETLLLWSNLFGLAACQTISAF